MNHKEKSTPTIHLTRLPELTAYSHLDKVIQLSTQDEMRQHMREYKDNFAKVVFILITAGEYAIEDIKLAYQFKARVLIGAQKPYATTSMSLLNKGLFLLKHAHTETQFTSTLADVITTLVKLTPCKLTPNDAKAALIDNLPSEAVTPNAKDKAINSLEKALTTRRDNIILHASVASDNPYVSTIAMKYGSELVQHIIDNPGIYALVGPMGCGKTQHVMLPLFEAFSAARKTPILCGAKQLLMGTLVNDDRHYHQVKKELAQPTTAETFTLGTSGVVNTLFSHTFLPVRKASQVLLIEELEDVLSHCVSHAVGRGDGALLPRAELLDSLLEQIKQSEHVILADALLSDHTVNLIAKRTGKSIYLCRPDGIVAAYPTITYFKNEGAIVATLQHGLQQGKTALTFTDAPHNERKSVFNGLFAHFSQVCGGTALMIDGEFAKQKQFKDFLKNTDEELKHYCYVQSSPVINSGLSIQNSHFDETHVWGYQTIHPLQLIQSLMRNRSPRQLNLFLDRTEYDIGCLDIRALLWEEIKTMKAIDDATALYDAYTANPIIIQCIERLLKERTLRVQYANHVLILLQHLGFGIEYKSSDERLEDEGKQLLRICETQEKKRKAHVVTNGLIDELENETDTQCVVLPSNFSYAKYRLKEEDIFNFYRVEEISQELFEFEDKHHGSELISNRMLLRLPMPQYKTLQEVQKQQFMKEICHILGLADDFSGEISTLALQELNLWLKQGKLVIGSTAYEVKKLMKQFTPHAKIAETQIKRTADGLLHPLFAIKIEEQKRGDKTDDSNSRKRTYQVVQNDIAVLAEKYYAEIQQKKTLFNL